MLAWALRRKALVAVVGLLSLAATFALYRKLPQGIPPRRRQGLRPHVAVRPGGRHQRLHRPLRPPGGTDRLRVSGRPTACSPPSRSPAARPGESDFGIMFVQLKDGAAPLRPRTGASRRSRLDVHAPDQRGARRAGHRHPAQGHRLHVRPVPAGPPGPDLAAARANRPARSARNWPEGRHPPRSIAGEPEFPATPALLPHSIAISPPAWASTSAAPRKRCNCCGAASTSPATTSRARSTRSSPSWSGSRGSFRAASTTSTCGVGRRARVPASSVLVPREQGSPNADQPLRPSALGHHRRPTPGHVPRYRDRTDRGSCCPRLLPAGVTASAGPAKRMRSSRAPPNRSR
jgi:hypothetical protein